MIYCIWYPSGGFGHYINSILSLYGEGFVRPKGNLVEFSDNGNSHKLDLIAPKYKNSQIYQFNFEKDKNYSVLIDNGINDEGKDFLLTFPGAAVIKLCYSDYTWPVVARTMIEKAMVVDFDSEIGIDFSADSWARREKYFLYLRDHNLRHCWKSDPSHHSIYIDDLLDYCQFQKRLSEAGIVVGDFNSTWTRWYKANYKFFSSITNAKEALEKVSRRENSCLDKFDTEWSQAVLYYMIWIKYGIEVPHNDFSNFFRNTLEIANWLNL